MIVRAITSLLGLRNLSWEQLQQAGIDVSRIGIVEYKTAKPKNGNGKFISEAQRRLLFARQMAKGVTELALKEEMEKRFKKSSTKELTNNELSILLDWIEAQPGKGGK